MAKRLAHGTHSASYKQLNDICCIAHNGDNHNSISLHLADTQIQNLGMALMGHARHPALTQYAN